MEAVWLKVQKEDAEAQKEAEEAAKRKTWKSDVDHLKNVT
jgi:hypothetical protein